MPIDILPDNVLLEIFDLCLHDHSNSSIKRANKWHRLVHVCQRWRRIIFESPCRLDLHISYTYGTPVWRNLHVWPVTLPLTIDYPYYSSRLVPEDKLNIFAALEHPGCIHRIAICAEGSFLSHVAVFMHKPFPALTHLELIWAPPHTGRGSPSPGRHLGGFPLHLQLPVILSSARNLVSLTLREISQDVSVLPETLVGCLAVLNALKTLDITFPDDQSPLDSTNSRSDLPRRTILPALTNFHYKGYSEYLEDILAQLDTPQLDNCEIEYFVHLIQAHQLTHFIDRTEGLNHRQFKRAEVTFFSLAHRAQINCSEGKYPQLSLDIVEQSGLGIQVECFADMLGQVVAMFPNVDQLSVHEDSVDPTSMESAEWIPFFCLFHAVEALHLSGGVTAYIVSALEDIGEEMVTDVFPALHLIWLDEDKKYHEPLKPVGSIERFLSLRQLSGLPVTIVRTEDEFFADNSDRKSL